MMFECKTMREFDDKISSKFFGFKNCVEYFDHHSDMDRFKLVQIPVLMINSLLDPILDQKHLPLQLVEKKENLFLICVRDGGHVTYPSGMGCENWSVVQGCEFMRGIEEEGWFSEVFEEKKVEKK